MYKKIFLLMLVGIFLFPFISAADDSVSFIWAQGDVVNYSFRCFDGNGNYCETGVDCMMNIEAPSGENLVDNDSMTATGTAYKYIMNTTNLGEHPTMIVCNNGTTSVSTSFTYLVTPSGESGTDNIAFIIFIILMIYGVTFAGFFGRNIPLTIIGGMIMMFLGVYMVNSGLIIYRNDLTNYFSYITIGIGFLFAMIASFEQFDVL